MRNKITARDNPLVKQTARLLKSREARQTEGLFLCEGGVMLEEALRSGAVRTRDMGGRTTTSQAGDAVASKVLELAGKA